MKIALSIGHVIGVCLPAAFIALGARPATAVPPLSSSEHPVTIRHLEGDAFRLSLSTPMVLEVQAVVDSVVASTPLSGSLVDSLLQALSDVYGVRLSSTAGAGYYYYWDGERWVIVCESSMTFEIDFGARGTVVVEASDAVIG